MTVTAGALAPARTALVIYREVANGTIAGALAGILVGGIGGRLAMRVAGALSDPSLVGVARTNNDNVLGNITPDGTFGLIIFAGLLPGILGGLVYVAAKPWLAMLGRWSGLGFGLVLLVAVGPAVIEPFNIDFRKFGSPQLNVTLFALLFVLFGIAVAALSSLVSRRWTPSSGSAWEVAGIVAVLVAGLVLFLAAFSLVNLAQSGRVARWDDLFHGEARAAVLYYLLAAPVALRLALGRVHPFSDARQLATGPRAFSYAVLLAPAVIGLPSTIDAFRFLVR